MYVVIKPDEVVITTQEKSNICLHSIKCLFCFLLDTEFDSFRVDVNLANILKEQST